MKNGNLKLKRPSQLQEVLDIARKLYKECVDLNKETLSSQETKTKLLQLKSVLEMYGHFSGINRKVQFKYQAKGKQNSSSEDGVYEILLLIALFGFEYLFFARSRRCRSCRKAISVTYTKVGW